MQTLTPASCSSLTRVCPRRIGPVSKRPCSTDVVQRVGHHVQAGPGDVADQPVGVGVVVGVHRRGVARGHPARHAAPDRLGHHHLDEPRVVVVGLVAVDVDAQAVLVGQRHRELDRLHAVLAGQLVVRDRRRRRPRPAPRPCASAPGRRRSRGCPAAGTRRAAGRSCRAPPRAGRPAPAARAAPGRRRRRGCARAGRRRRAASAAPAGPATARPRSVRSSTRSAQTAMPSNSEPDTFGRGWPTVSTASRWMCGSTSGGVTSRPARSMVSRALAVASAGDDPAAVDAEVGERVLPRDAGVAKDQIDHPAIIAARPDGGMRRPSVAIPVTDLPVDDIPEDEIVSVV